MCRTFKMTHERAQELLFAMTDTDGDVRKAVYTLLGSCTFSTGNALVHVVRSLLSLLTTRADDRDGILRALHSMGKSHVEEVAGNMTVLLDCGDQLLRPDPCIDDLAHLVHAPLHATI